MRTMGDEKEHLYMHMAHPQVAPPGIPSVLSHLGSNRPKRMNKQAAPTFCVWMIGLFHITI